MVEKPEKRYSPDNLEKEIQEYWEKNDIYRKVKEHRREGEDYYFVDGPPYTSGNVHIGTAWNKTLKDLYVRYQRMKGYNVRDQPGFDMHGLPIEVKVEREMGIKNKKDIERIGIEKFVQKCREFALKNKEKMTEQFKGLGVWLDWEHPYLTIDNGYIQAAWNTLRKAHEKGLLYEDEKVLPWCPRCETALAEAEIEYWEEDDPSIYVKFPFEDGEESILIWTTTPWTIPGNLAVAVHPDYPYVKVRYEKEGESETIITLEDTVKDVMAEVGIENYTIIERLGGSQLIGRKYKHPLKDLIPGYEKLKEEWVHKVITFDGVERDRSGVVHIAPGHGPEDFEVGKEYGLPPFCPVDGEGRLTADAGAYKGLHVKKANNAVLEDLRRRGALIHHGTVTHRYGHCWRCETPIIYRTTTQWFLRVTELKERMLEEVERIKWYPDWAGSSRQRDWVMNVRDWCISRQRFWGIPLPIWKCRCGEIFVAGSAHELPLKKKKKIDLHRPWVDKIKVKCKKCGKVMTRIPDVMDVWFDSAVCSWASLGYPTNKEEFERWWPARWIVEAHDQTRGWFYSQLGAGVIAFNRSPYDSVLMHGFALDKDGRPMSKSLGNVVDPEEVIEKYGRDALRLWFLSSSAPWEDLPFSWEGIKNAHRTLNILWNVYVFAATYMALDKYEPYKHQLKDLTTKKEVEDNWILSRMENMSEVFNRSMQRYEVHTAYRALEHFIVEDLSRWYVKLIRDRLWIEGEDATKISAYITLHRVLMKVIRFLAPATPHICERIYKGLDGPLPSVHMCDWPTDDPTLIRPELEEHMKIIQEIVEATANARQKANINLRWPVKRIVIKAEDERVVSAVNSIRDILLQQTNAKKVEIIEPGETWEEMSWDVKPNLHAIGPVFRQWASKIGILLRSRPPKALKEAIEKGEYVIGIEGQKVVITPEMVEFIPVLPRGIVEASFSKGSVYLDTEMTEEIRAEGFSREIIRRIQQMRKDLDLSVEEYIETRMVMSEELSELIMPHVEHIAEETRTYVLEFVDEEGFGDEYVVRWEIGGEEIYIGIIPIQFEEALAEEHAAIEEGEEALLQTTQQIPEASEAPRAEVGEAVEAEYVEYEKIKTPAAESTPSKHRDEKEILATFMAIPGVGKAKAKALIKAYNTLADLRRASLEDIQKVKGISKRLAKKIKEYVDNLTPEGLRVCELCGALFEPTLKECPRCRTPATGMLEKMDVLPECELQEGSTYLMETSDIRKAYDKFKICIQGGKEGLCISREFPDKVQKRYDLSCDMIWLSDIGGRNTIRPRDLERLSLTMEQFIAEKKGTIMLDGVEYLITNNNFNTVLRLIQSIKDQVAVHQAILLIPISPTALNSQQMNILKREVGNVIGG